MKARILKVKDIGSCTYCRRGELKADGMGLDFPYDEVIEISGNQSTSRLCYECAKKVAVLTEMF